MSATDWLILAPAIPVIPILVTWWLPWESWIPWAKLPKAILGPYALYVFLVAYHFDEDHRYWWLYYGWLVPVGFVLSVMAVVEKVRRKTTEQLQKP